MRNRTTQTAEIPWEMMVARAAPRTPIWNTNMRIGSRMMLHMAPMSTVYMPVLAYPWALMKALSPRASCTKMVPRE